MNNFLVTILVASIVGNQFQASEAQVLTSVIRIQSCNDNTYVGIPPSNAPEQTTTIAPTTTTTQTPAEPTTTTPPTTPPPVPVQPIPSPGTGNLIIYWKVNWANSVTNGTGSVIVASDATSRDNRCLTETTTGIGAAALPTLPTGAAAYTWNFISVFDSATWTYKYRIQHKSGKCLRKVRGAPEFTLVDLKTTTITIQNEILFNILS